MNDKKTSIDPSAYNSETGLPKDQSYFERGLPPYLQISLENMIKSDRVKQIV